MTPFELQLLDHEQRGLIAVWSTWMQWFCWFFGAQVLLLWTNRKLARKAKRIMAALWIAFGACGTVMALLVAEYTWRIGKEFPEIGFPTRYAALAALFNALPLIAGCFVWRKTLCRQKDRMDCSQ